MFERKKREELPVAYIRNTSWRNPNIALPA